MLSSQEIQVRARCLGHRYVSQINVVLPEEKWGECENQGANPGREQRNNQLFVHQRRAVGLM